MTGDGGLDEHTFVAAGLWTARREERKATNWIAKIRLFDGQEIPTTVKDVSTAGARLTVPEEMELPERFMFRVIGRDFVCAVRMMWRRGSNVGVQIERVGKIEAKAAPQAEGPAEASGQGGQSGQSGQSGGDALPRRGSRISQ